ncbi:hypothetical protein BJ508DRAFT_326389 [Ascobolus immersus RN42]|uniref:Uncharacterized protein n=1 Tax=Ascobolus immersus RN42 TaxID=1160509 RepID=A0A3N4I5Y1_ASCIM|nr:hypothetical protein BJ508DRAFT_326389 [Ascobolus immersus RN42]
MSLRSANYISEAASILRAKVLYLLDVRLARLEMEVKLKISGKYRLLSHEDAQASIRQAEENVKHAQMSIELAKSNQALAEEMRRDSSSMKTVAIMTMIFLPGTFFSALFAMPSLKWPERPGVIQEGFGLYWALTVTSTAIVFATWYLTTHREEVVRKMKTQRVEIGKKLDAHRGEIGKKVHGHREEIGRKLKGLRGNREKPEDSQV